jgi:hypothetical protein
LKTWILESAVDEGWMASVFCCLGVLQWEMRWVLGSDSDSDVQNA